MNRIVLAVECRSAGQENAVTIFCQARGWNSWHWLPHVWLLADLPDEMTPRSLWGAIIALPGMASVRGLAFSCGPDPAFWGGGPIDSWIWMRRFWGEAAR